MSVSASPLPRAARWGLLLFVVLPSVPGLLFLLTGFVIDPHRRPQDLSPRGQAQYASDWARTRGLYLAGGVTLMVGTLGMGAVAWKIAHPGSYEDDEATETSKEPPR